MNKSELVTHDQAVILKELGFNKPCFYHYVDGTLVESCYCGDEVLVCDLLICENEKDFYHIQDAPFLYQVQDWILEAHGIFVNIAFDTISKKGYFGYWDDTRENGDRMSYIPEGDDCFYDNPYNALSNILTEYLDTIKID